MNFLLSWNCLIWLAISGVVTGLFAVIVGIFDKNTSANTTSAVSISAFVFGAFPALFYVERGFMGYFDSLESTLWLMTSTFFLIALASAVGSLNRKGQGWKIGLMGLLAFHFGIFSVFFPIS